ncbi:MAG: exodeoxyribonuclease VII large subunit [Ilumatobacteraceae bacterium]
MSDPTYTVTELAGAINDRLRAGFPDGVWVRGEIDGLRDSGQHTYFSLSEVVDGKRATLSVSLFASVKRTVTPILRQHRLQLENGTSVRLFGHLDFYAPSGRLGLKMSTIDPNFTLGELSQARDRVLRRLVEAGLAEANSAAPLGPVPLRIGVVTSVGSAAWHDFVHELEGSGFGFRVSVCDTRVQGDGAEASVAAAIRHLGRRDDLDLVAVIRGGGSRNDLATFDAEDIALAIAGSPLPVFTGIGHEIDRSIADEVAHTAYKTPTACAGAIVDIVAVYRTATEEAWAEIVRRATSGVTVAHSSLAATAHRVAARTHAAVDRADERLHVRFDRLRSVPVRRLAECAATLDRASTSLQRSATRSVASATHSLDERAARVAVLDPAALLRRGWSITRDAGGRVVRSVSDVSPGTVITTQLADGELSSRIEER